METARFGHKVRFTMNGTTYAIPSTRHLTSDEFCPMLYYTRRLLGYVVYPRWFMTRLFLSEVIEVLKRQKIYKFELKRSVSNVITEFNLLESMHRKDFNSEFLEVMACNLSTLGLKKINELRVGVGEALMRANIKKYIVYSYPYTFLNLCFDNTVNYNQCMNQVKEKYGVDFTKVFIGLKGEKLRQLATNMMDKFVDVMGEEINQVDFEGSGCIEKLEALSGVLLDEQNLHDAFQEAYEEVPNDKKNEVYDEMNIWTNERQNLNKN